MLGMGGKDRELEAAVRELADADTLAFGGVGFAGQVLPVTEAYQRVEAALAEHPEAAGKKVRWLLKHGSPAGRAYAATLLERVDPAAGREAWTRLRDDRGEFTTFNGCLMDKATLGEYAAERLAAG
ncbi:hypothetical protein AB0H57_10700 [Micromonospora sp. NPDC050686]|uniref:hypothetical protein n=1 Tax=Micromonospora sp. NPDC050686 TaxID=3154631 RepID=UPI0033F95725